MAYREQFSKKHWFTPELRVLSRGESEENVLDACKIGHTSGPASRNCMWKPGWQGPKVPCHTRSNS